MNKIDVNKGMFLDSLTDGLQPTGSANRDFYSDTDNGSYLFVHVLTD